MNAANVRSLRFPVAHEQKKGDRTMKTAKTTAMRRMQWAVGGAILGMAAFLMSAPALFGAAVSWDAGGSPSLNWGTFTNWSDDGSPSSDSLTFNNTGASATQGTVTNIPPRSTVGRRLPSPAA